MNEYEEIAINLFEEWTHLSARDGKGEWSSNLILKLSKYFAHVGLEARLRQAEYMYTFVHTRLVGRTGEDLDISVQTTLFELDKERGKIKAQLAGAKNAHTEGG